MFSEASVPAPPWTRWNNPEGPALCAFIVSVFTKLAGGPHIFPENHSPRMVVCSPGLTLGLTGGGFIQFQDLGRADLQWFWRGCSSISIFKSSQGKKRCPRPLGSGDENIQVTKEKDQLSKMTPDREFRARVPGLWWNCSRGRVILRGGWIVLISNWVKFEIMTLAEVCRV